MVKRIFNFIGQEVNGLHQAAYLLGFFAVLSQLLALVRDRLLAHQFGATHVLDIYYAAFRIPDLIFVTVASMVSISVIIPFLMERMAKGEKESREFIDSVFSTFFLIIAFVAVVGWIAAPFLLKLFFPSFDQDFETLVAMTRIMLLSPIFLGFSNFLASITQIYRRFFIYAISPIVYNFGIIIGLTLLYPFLGIYGLAWGVALGAFLHFFIQVPFVLHKSLFPRLRLPIKFPDVKRVLMVSLPRTITLSSNEIAEFFLIALAGTFTGGAISVFNFAWNLQSVPLSVVGVSYSLAAFPVLTRLFTSGDHKKFVDQMIVTTKHILFWSLPIMTLFIVLRAQLVRVVLGSGHFNWSDTRLTAAALALFSISLIPQSLTALFVKAYYSRGDTKKPLFMNLISAACIVVISFILVRLFQNVEAVRFGIAHLLKVDGVPGSLVLMLPLGFSIGSVINLIMHWLAFETDFKGYTLAVARSVIESLGSAMVMGFASYALLTLFEPLFNIETTIGIFLQGFSAGVIGLSIYFLILTGVGNQEIKVITQTLKQKIWRAKVIPPDVPAV